MTIHQTNLSASSCSLYLHVILLFSICLLCLQPNFTATAPTNGTDRLALLKFKESVPHDPYNILNSWNDSMHFCNWLGIKCSRRHQRVTVLDLQGYKLRGSLSPYIGNLSFLRSIILTNNSFYGQIPREIGRLFRLQQLYLDNNTLEGEIPSNLSNCSNLIFIYLGVNKLTGKIPAELGSLMKLERLRLPINNLAGGIPSSLGNLSLLNNFNVEYNNLVGNVPGAIGQLKHLRLFAIGINKLSGTIPSSLYNMSSLKIFSAAVNQLNGTLPANIGLILPNLQNIFIGGNEFSGTIPTSLCNATQLELIDLSGNKFLGSVPTNLGNLLNISWLDLSDNNLGRGFPFLTSLTNCSKLTMLDLSANQFGGVLPNSLSNLSTQLTKIYLGGNEISGTIPASLGNFINLYAFGLDDNHFTSIIPTSFGRFQKMQALFLSGNKLFGEIPTIIGNLTRLFRLDLQENKLEGTIPLSIVNCQNLQLLDISQNNLNGSIPQQLIGPSSLPLLLLNLSHNSFSGKLPFEVGNLKIIIGLDVSNNNLSGEIPTSIGNFLMLENLYLQGNSFEGAISSSMASLKGLRHLDLSQNNLSGPIPEGLKKLPLLENLNLSFNNFVGEVPTEGVFKNTSAISLIGNTKLCGGIPKLQLPKCPVKVMKPRKSISFKLRIVIISIFLLFFLFSSFLVLFWVKKSKKKPPSMVSTIGLLPNVSYKELYQVTSGFSPNNLIGSGSFGTVYKGALDQEERLVAIKVLNLQKKGASKSFMAECNALQNIRHRNLVKIITCCSSIDYRGNQFKALVFEFMSNGSLDNWLHPGLDNENQSRNLSLLQRLNVAIDVAFAIEYLHNHSVQPIIHCDLKPSNVLLDKDMVAHVSDFGLARLLSITNDSSGKQTSTVGIKGSIGYAAPEYGMGGEASAEGDMYSYGILLLEIFLGKRPTDDIFKDGLNIHNFAMMALPDKIVQIVDPTLLLREVDEAPSKIVATREDNNDNEIQVDKEAQGILNLCQMDANVHKCLVSILETGLACSMESPKDRMKMKEVTRELHLIKSAFLGSGIRKSGFRRIQV
ncbi:putative receptor-like protein kinase At3g47110 [Quercus lobata]|uniref:non-specific serine/threonine protein kinase n=1 Tax=Quercus lobata TaxID=97700 RepID=A0A7N2MEX9_QUELO|nr:putative receptor-like protein kinase At3g47110 [Quercus lobata]XP_030928686.1 putative receptor-like protein kinase At3g47110 [Quercus lobata]